MAPEEEIKKKKEKVSQQTSRQRYNLSKKKPNILFKSTQFTIFCADSECFLK